MKLFQIFRDFLKSRSDGVQPAAPGDNRDRWRLMVGDITLGELVYHSYETPLITADFVPTTDFARFIPYFEWDRDLAMNPDRDASAEDGPNDPVALIDEVCLLGGIRIVDLKSNETSSTLINFAGDYTYATFR